MRFEVAGPFKLKRHGNNNIITKRSLVDLKAAMEHWDEELPDACGCYVFALQAGRGSKPYYVGQACRRSLFAESMNSENIVKYNEILGDRVRGAPVMYFLPMMTPKGKFRKRSRGNNGLAALDFFERWLIATSLEKNSKLANNKETRFLRKIHVVGIFNAKQGESTIASRKLKSVLWW